VVRTLHIVKSSGSPPPWDLLAQESVTDGTCAIVLIQDAVATRSPLNCPTFVLERDAQTRGASTPYPLITDERLVDLIWESDNVVVW
jgi:sulfur transfer complex TusBCD TusB component (DsrH family)